MKCGTPVIAASTSSMPEIAGEGNALFFNPAFAQQLAEQMNQLRSTELRQQLSEKGKRREEQFSWKKTAEIILPLLTNW